MKKLRIMKKGTTILVAMLMIMMGSSVVKGQNQNSASSENDSTHMQQQYSKQDNEMKYDDEVSADEINTSVSTAIVEKYPEYGIAKVYQAKEGSYKVELANEDEQLTAYFSENGELLNVENNEDMNKDEDLTMNQDSVFPQEQFQRSTDAVDYSEEIDESELPQSITSSLDDLYPNHEIKQVYRGDNGSYKVKVKNDGAKAAVYYDSEGLFERDEQLNNMTEEDNKDTNQDW